jgi:putative DNA primase/helicase
MIERPDYMTDQEWQTVLKGKANGKKDGAKQTANGIRFIDLRDGCEPIPVRVCMKATVHATILQNATVVEMELIVWLWHYYVAQGNLHILAGPPGAGKSTLAFLFAATISAGAYWPDGTRAPQGNVLIWSSEDSVADTIKPRLVRMCADLSRIYFVKGQHLPNGKKRPFNPATDMADLTEVAKFIRGGVALLIIDPIVQAIPAKLDSHKNAETRQGLQPVIDFAEEFSAAVIGISHFTKGTAGKDPIERVTGSLAFGAAPRIVFAATKMQSDDGPPRIFTRAKSNIGPDGGGFGFDLEAAPLFEMPDVIATRIAWHDALEGSARELLADAETEAKEDETKIERAERFLTDVLAKGERQQIEVEGQAKREGISERTLRRAAKTKVAKRKSGLTGPWLWRLI